MLLDVKVKKSWLIVHCNIAMNTGTNVPVH